MLLASNVPGIIVRLALALIGEGRRAAAAAAKAAEAAECGPSRHRRRLRFLL
jgi:hypothetical protein